jgi:hypothetical protein
MSKQFLFEGEFLFMTEQEAQNLLAHQQLLLEQSFKLRNIVLILSKTKSIVLLTVSSYEAVEKLDDNLEPTGEYAPVIFCTGGNEVELTPEENDIFRAYWNKVVYVDQILANVNLQVVEALFPTPEQPQLQEENQTANA